MQIIDLIEEKNWTSFLLIDDDKLLALCKVDYFLSSKPGGQHRDKKVSSVRLKLKNTRIVVSASENRSLNKNIKIALKKLRIEVTCQLRSNIDLNSFISIFKLDEVFDRTGLIINRKLLYSSSNKNYLPLCAFILDYLHNDKWGISAFSKKFSISNTNIVSFLSKEKRLLVWVNQERVKNGMNLLK